MNLLSRFWNWFTTPNTEPCCDAPQDCCDNEECDDDCCEREEEGSISIGPEERQ